MGNQSSEISQKNQLLEQFSVQKTIQHPIYGECTIVQDKETNIYYIMKQQKTTDESENQNFNDLVEERMKLDNDGLLSPVGHTTIIDKDMINLRYISISLYENLQQTLADDILIRKNNNQLKYTEVELWNIIAKSIDGLSYLQSIQFEHQNIAAENFIYEKGTLKVIDFASSTSLFYEALVNHRYPSGLYLSQIQMKALKQQKNLKNVNLYKQDAFSFGCMILQAANLSPLDDCFDYHNFSINFEKIYQILNSLSYSHRILNFIKIMIQQNEDQMMDFIQLQQILDKKSNLQRVFNQTKKIQNLFKKQKKDEQVQQIEKDQPIKIQDSVEQRQVVSPHREQTQKLRDLAQTFKLGIQKQVRQSRLQFENEDQQQSKIQQIESNNENKDNSLIGYLKNMFITQQKQPENLKQQEQKFDIGKLDFKNQSPENLRPKYLINEKSDISMVEKNITQILSDSKPLQSIKSSPQRNFQDKEHDYGDIGMITQNLILDNHISPQKDNNIFLHDKNMNKGWYDRIYFHNDYQSANAAALRNSQNHQIDQSYMQSINTLENSQRPKKITKMLQKYDIETEEIFSPHSLRIKQSQGNNGDFNVSTIEHYY